MVLGEFGMMADDGYEKVCKIKSLLAECMVPPRESQFLNLDRYIEEENGVSFIPDPPNWSNISFRGFQGRVLTYRPQHWGADPNAVLWLSKYGWRCTEKFVIKCDICSSTVECSSLIQKPDLWGDIAHKAHDNLCYWSFCPCPDRFIQIVTHPKILCKNICQNWQKIITYGNELPKIQQDLLDKMGVSKDVLQHMFRIIKSSFSEEGMSALLLVICGWLKSSEDKTLECAYCQRHLALRHFFSIAESCQVSDSVPVEDALCSGNDETKMDVSETVVCKSLPSETGIGTSEDDIELICTLQQRKGPKKGRPAIHISTARHRARALACVTRRKFPSFCNILHLRYGAPLTSYKIFQKREKDDEEEYSGNNHNVEDRLMTDGSGSPDKKPTEELYYVDKTNTDTASNGTSLGNNKRKLPNDQETENIEICHIDKQQRVTVDVPETGNNNISSTEKEGTDTVASVERDPLHSESEHGDGDSEMVTTSSHDAVLERNMTESNLPVSDQSMGTSEHQLEGNGVSLSSDGMQNKHDTKPDEVLLSEERPRGDSNFEKQESETETEQSLVVPDSGKVDPNPGKRQLICDDDQQMEGTNKRMKISSEHSYLKKKDLNPVNEHRFWCMWRIKTVDRLLGSTKEGWRQILDLLKYGVSPQNSEAEEEETGDLFEEVKKIHSMMTNW